MTALEELDLSTVTGYSAEDRYLATQFLQGGRTVYAIDLPVDAVPNVLPVPDPDRPTPGNRRVRERHARSFGRYVAEHPEWVAPPLLIRDPGIARFELQSEHDGVRIGILAVPRTKRHMIKIIDGQHRILGLDYKLRDLDSEIDHVTEAKRLAEQKEETEEAERQSEVLRRLLDQRERFARERIGVHIYVEDRPGSYEQMFFDVADNALGISQAVKARFDSRKVVNRAIDTVMDHSLLKERVDQEQDRISGDNPNLVGAKHVVDIIRAVNVGVAGRVGRRKEAELDEATLAEHTHAFLTVLQEAFEPLASISDGTLQPKELRKTSLLGSVTMLRVLAGVYHNLRVREVDDDEIRDFFESLAPHMAAPIARDSLWLAHTDVFNEGAFGPQARAQNLKSLAHTISTWYDEPPEGWF